MDFYRPWKVFMLVSMANNTPNRYVPPSSPGAAIVGRRRHLGLTQEDVIERTGNVINARLLSRLENDHVNPSTLRISKYRALIDVLQWTADEFTTYTGATAPLNDVPGSQPYRPVLDVPLIGTVSAGLASFGGPYIDVDSMPLDPNSPALRGASLGDLVWLRVNGDSMVSERAARHIPPNSHIVVEVGASPADGNLVVAWLPNRETAVLKEYREHGDAVLRSYSPLGPTFNLVDEPIEIRGVVRMIQSYP